MYQALYRKWRPRTFDDVVGQEHITETLKRQAAEGRLSHAYLFTGTRGTGKTTCAKILARAVNCRNPQDGNPCNQCPACLGIENGSILDVLELDAASNNGVDQVRALRDEAVYTPAAVKKRVYIIDEAHMLTNQAWNALLKILEEPPAHLMFVLATTEPHKVLATIRSRCQQFSFKRILPMQISRRLEYVAEQENIPLTKEGAALLARLADGGMRDALSLLDQCAGGKGTLDEQAIYDTLGLAGSAETAALMERLALRDTAAALDTLARLYAGGREVGSVLGELSALARDLLLRKTAPQGSAALMSGGYDEATLRRLGELLSSQRLLQMLTQLQAASASLARSANRRTDAELCLIRLSDESLDESFTGLSARLARVEEQLAKGIPAPPPPSAPVPKAEPPKGAKQEAYVPYWEEELPPPPDEPPPEERSCDDMELEYDFDLPEPVPEPPRPQGAPPQKAPASPPPVSRPAAVPAPPAPEPVPQPAAPSPQAAPADQSGGDSTFWPSFAAGLRGKVPPTVMPYLNNPAKVTGVWKNGMLTLWVDSEFTRSMLNKPAVVEKLTAAAAASFGGQPQVSVVTGTPPPEQPPSSVPEAAEEKDPLNDLLAFGGLDNITIQ